MLAAERQARLESELRQASLRYTMHEGGVAGFRHAQGRGPTLSMAAVIHNGVLSLICDHLQAVPPVGLVEALNRVWWLGRIWRRRDGAIGLAAGYPAFLPASGASVLRAYLAGLYAAATALIEPGTDKEMLCEAVAAAHTLLPACDVEKEMVSAAEALRDMGMPFRDDDGLVLWQEVEVGRGVWCQIEICAPDRQVLLVEMSTPVRTLPTPGQLDRLNQAAPIGTFIAEAGQEVLRHRWAYSPLIAPATPRFMAWLLEVAGQMALLAQRTIAAGDGSRHGK